MGPIADGSALTAVVVGILEPLRSSPAIAPGVAYVLARLDRYVVNHLPLRFFRRSDSGGRVPRIELPIQGFASCLVPSLVLVGMENRTLCATRQQKFLIVPMR